MQANGSPPAEFDFDEDHSYFMVRLPVHPAALEVADLEVGDSADAVTGQVTGQGGTKSALSRHQVEILNQCKEERPIGDLMEIAKRTDRTKFRNQVLNPLLNAGLLEMTIPDKPRSSKQKYRLTEKGRAVVVSLERREA